MRVKELVLALRPDIVAGYVAFLLLALLPSLVASVGETGFRVTLADLLGGHAAPAGAAGVGATGTLIVLLAAATLAFPRLWKSRWAALAGAVPLLVTLLGLWPLYRQHQSDMEAIDALKEFGLDPQQLVEQVDVGSNGPLGHLSIAAWSLFGVVTYLAFRGVMRAVAAPAPSASSAS